MVLPAAAERINHEGRVLGDLPIVSSPILFNTAAADAVVAAMQILPRDNPWNEDISRRPLLANSDAMIAQIAADLDSTRRNLRAFHEMNFVLVPDDQPTQSIRFFNYPGESDLDGGVSPNGLYPIPSNLPVETWPRETGNLTLSQWQQDSTNLGGDRHSIIVKPGAGFIWETWLTKLVSGAWRASNGAKFNLNSNSPRPPGWTSADAAGLPMFPAIVRYDECQRGMVEHAMRIVVKRTRLGPIYPATHEASVGSLTDPNIPAMGQRLRLKSSFAIPSTWTTAEKAVLKGLKKYGAMVADNGNFFSISVTPDNRFAAGEFGHLSSIPISEFEVVQTTGPNEGPRSLGGPTVNAGADIRVPFGTSASLSGSMQSANGATVQWRKYSGPGAVSFTAAGQAVTSASFTQPGSYLLMLSADDSVHAVAYDAVRVEVTLTAQIARVGADVQVQFPTAVGQMYRVERAGDLAGANWSAIGGNLAGTGSPIAVTDVGAIGQGRRFYRVAVLP
jgi:hypothetical protein